MIININDSTNSAKELYYQSLVLLYLPCEKFSKEDIENKMFVTAFQKDGRNYADVKLEIGDKVSSVNDSQIIDDTKYAQMKNFIGRLILKAFHAIFGFVPPWGISTGVKPVKLARMFVSDLGAKEAYRILTEEYMISSRKAEMAVSACLFEDKVNESMGEKPCSLYISIPFCPSKCSYCSFVSCTTPRLLSLIPEYLEKLNGELERISHTIKTLGLSLKSIYVGGGTPAILSDKQIYNLLSCVHNGFDLSQLLEFTFEAGRPDMITFEKLKVLSDFGVERISINTQTSNDDVLRTAGRKHTFGDYLDAMELARKVGFKCINTDLIAGLPGEDAESFCKSVRDVCSANPENITVHAFTLKKSSDLRMGGEKGFYIDNQTAIEITDYAADYLSSFGYNPYYIYRQKNTVGNLDNAGYSKKGFESIYNIIMMGEYHTVFGAGAGSVTKLVTSGTDRVDRLFSPKYPYEFLDGEKYGGFDVNKVCNILEER